MLKKFEYEIKSKIDYPRMFYRKLKLKKLIFRSGMIYKKSTLRKNELKSRAEKFYANYYIMC